MFYYKKVKGTISLLFNERIIKGNIVATVFAIQEGHGRPWMHIQLTGKHVRNVKPPRYLFSKRNDIILKTLQDRANMKPGIFQKP